jgi:hypothetical protein
VHGAGTGNHDEVEGLDTRRYGQHVVDRVRASTAQTDHVGTLVARSDDAQCRSKSRQVAQDTSATNPNPSGRDPCCIEDELRLGSNDLPVVRGQRAKVDNAGGSIAWWVSTDPGTRS